MQNKKKKGRKNRSFGMSGNYGSQNMKQVILVCTVDTYIVLSLSVVYIIYILKKKKVNKQTSLNIVFAPVSS